MSIPPAIVSAARISWKWQWIQLMNGLAPADREGNYLRPPSQHKNAQVPQENDLKNLSTEQLPKLIIGRSCPWAHRTWIVHQLRGLDSRLKVLIAKADHNSGRWQLEPPWLGCNSLLDLYKHSGESPSHRATVPALIKPGLTKGERPQLLGNESAQLVEVLNLWPSSKTDAPDLSPLTLQDEINTWQNVLQPYVNDGVYRCGFARNQSSYDKASRELFQALEKANKSLSKKGPWLCGSKMTIADVRLFPTLIRWEMVYAPLFGCTYKPLWAFPRLWEWRKRFFSNPLVSKTCDSDAWRNDYFGALFPLRPSSIIPSGSNLSSIVNASTPSP